MWRLTIRLNTDGDFKHRSTFVSNELPEVTYIFNSRKQAVKVLKEFYDELNNTIGGDINEYNWDYISTIKDFKDYLYKLLDRFETLRIAFVIGNPEFEIELIQVKTEEINTIKGTYAKKIIEYLPNVEMSIKPDFKNDFNWNVLWSIESIYGGNNNEQVI